MAFDFANGDLMRRDCRLPAFLDLVFGRRLCTDDAARLLSFERGRIDRVA